MSKQVELDVKTKKASEETSITPSGEKILAQLGINSALVKAINQGIKRSYYRAVINWLTKYKANPEDSNLKKVKGLLEAFYNLCQVEDWEEAEKLLLNTPTREELHNQLGTWGYYYQQIELYTKLIGEIIYSQNKTFLNALANAYFTVGNYDQAIHYHNQRLAQEQKSGNQEGEAIYLKNLGVVYYSIGDYISAIQLFEKSLEINKKLEDLHGEATVLGELGNVYHDKGNYIKAIKCWHKTLEIMQKFNDFQREVGSLVNLGFYTKVLIILTEQLNCFSKVLKFSVRSIIYKDKGKRLTT